MKKYLMVSSALAGLIIFNAQALAQWQVPNHSTPIGRGPGVTGFNSAAPGAAGGVLTSNGTGSDPTFQPASPAGVPFSLCNGSDQTTYMQAILDSAAKGAFVPEGLICASQIGIVIPAGKSLEIGNGGEIKKFGSSNNVLIDAGGDNVSLIAHGTGAVNMNSDPLGNVSFRANGVSGLLIDGVNFKNGTLHDVYFQEVTNSKVINNSFINNAYFSNFIAYNLTTSSANLAVSYNNFDRSAMVGNCIFFAPQAGRTVSRVSVQGNRCSGPAGDTSPDEHSLLVMLGQQLATFPGLNVKDNFAFNMNFPYSIVGASEGTVGGNGCENGGSPGGGTYGYEVALNTNVAYSNNQCVGGFIFAGAVAIINTSTGISWNGGVLENTSATANAQGFQVIETAPGVGKRNVISATTIKVAGGYGFVVNGDDAIFNANILNGNGVGISPFIFNVGGNRVVTSNFETGWTGAKFSGAVASDTICANNSGGCKIPSSYSGDTGGELALGGGGADLHSEISTLSTGTPILAYRHRGASNTGSWLWANGTASSTTRMRLTGTGEFLFNGVVAPSTPSAGTAAVYVDSTTKALTSKDDAGALHTTVIADTGAANNFMTAISAAGVISKAQPSISNLSGFGTGVATALGINVGTAGSFVVNGGALGTPSSGVGTNITNVNAATLGGATFAAPGAIGGGTPGAGSFTTGTFSGQFLANSSANIRGVSFPVSGIGIELFYDASGVSGVVGSRVLSYDRSGAAFQPLYVDASTWTLGFAGATTQARFQVSTASTSKTTGAVRIDGGIGIGGAVYTDTLNIITVANTATTRALCWDNTTGLVSENGTVGTCTVSKLAAKDLIAKLSDEDGFEIVMAMQPWRYTLKPGPAFVPGEQIGFVADFAMYSDRRFVSFDDDGKPEGFRYEQYTAALTGAVHKLKADNDNLAARVEMLEKRATAR